MKKYGMKFIRILLLSLSLLLLTGCGAISIHAPREGSDRDTGGAAGAQEISIHAPREGSDPQPTGCGRSLLNFNPRSP